MPVDGAECLKTCISFSGGFSKPRRRRSSSAALIAHSAATRADSDGSHGRAIRLARLQTAVVMRAPPPRPPRAGCLLDAPAAARRIACSGMRPRLGEAIGVDTGEGISSGISRLGEIGRNLSCTMASLPRLGDCLPILAEGSLSVSDGLTTTTLRFRVRILQSACSGGVDNP